MPETVGLGIVTVFTADTRGQEAFNRQRVRDREERIRIDDAARLVAGTGGSGQPERFAPCDVCITLTSSSAPGVCVLELLGFAPRTYL